MLIFVCIFPIGYIPTVQQIQIKIYGIKKNLPYKILMSGIMYRLNYDPHISVQQITRYKKNLFWVQ
jgi:hypothetical protein